MSRVAVLIPCFAQAPFLPRALRSLTSQTFQDWQALIIDDGSPDNVSGAALAWLEDDRISYHRIAQNIGLGAALNIGLDRTDAPLIAYLPSDDVWFDDHLETLVAALDAEGQAQLAVSGLRHHNSKHSKARIDGFPLQLVQSLHRRGDKRWIERSELTTDNLDRMFWDKLGPPVETHRLTCEWVDHPDQRHKFIQEPLGGINPYRVRYQVTQPLIFHSSTGHRIDEASRYAKLRERNLKPSPDGLKILLVGELAYNPERVIALAEAGHQLFGLWMDKPYWYNWVGPLPFGHVTDLPRNDWQAAIRRIKPDVIYALLNWQAVPFAHHVMRENPGVPFVWHFKEGPFICLEHGCWEELLALHTHADGVIHSSDEMRDWFETVLPVSALGRPQMVLDGDLPKRDWLLGERSERLSARDGEIHTVVPGRPIGLHPETVAELAAGGVHLHFYGEFTHGQWREWIVRTKALAGRYIHLHPNTDQEDWVEEFSRYDAGWLHGFASRNGGDIARANWDDLNIPARIATLAAAGLPMIQRKNDGHRVAIQRIAQEIGGGVLYDSISDLCEQLRGGVQQQAENVWAGRDEFRFDSHVARLTAFLSEIAAGPGRSFGAPRPTRSEPQQLLAAIGAGK